MTTEEMAKEIRDSLVRDAVREERKRCERIARSRVCAGCTDGVTDHNGCFMARYIADAIEREAP